MERHVALGHGPQVGGRHQLTALAMDDPDRTPLVGHLLHEAPGLGRMRAVILDLVEATQDQAGQITDLIRQGHGTAPVGQSASSRAAWIRARSPVRPKLITIFGGLPSSVTAKLSTQYLNAWR